MIERMESPSQDGGPLLAEDKEQANRKRRRLEEGGGPAHKRHEEQKELLQILKSSIEEGKDLLKQHGLALSKQHAPPGQDFSRGRVLCQKALRVQYTPEGGPPGRVEVVDLYIKNEPPRADRPNQAKRISIDQRFYLAQLPPGVSLDKREALRYAMRPADPTSSAEGSNMPLLVIMDKPVRAPAGNEVLQEGSVLAPANNSTEPGGLATNSSYNYSLEEARAEAIANSSGVPAEQEGESCGARQPTGSARARGGSASRGRKSTGKAKGFMPLSRRETRMPSAASRAELVAFGKQLINPEATCVQDFPCQIRTRFEQAIRMQYQPRGKTPTAVQACDLYVSIFQSSAANTGTLDIRFFLKETDLPPGVCWNGDYEFEFCCRPPNIPLLVVRDPLRPPPQDPVADTPHDAVTSGPIASAVSGPGGAVTAADTTAAGHTQESPRESPPAGDSQQAPGVPWPQKPTEAGMAWVLEGLHSALVVLGASEVTQWRFWCWARQTPDVEVVDWCLRRCKRWEWLVRAKTPNLEAISTVFDDLDAKLHQHQLPPTSAAGFPAAPLLPAAAEGAQGAGSHSGDKAKPVLLRYIVQAVSALAEVGSISDELEVDLLDALDVGAVIGVEELQRCVVEVLHPAWERQDRMGLLWGLLVLVKGRGRRGVQGDGT